ncbi:MAG: Bug family tripartite tricarboxylate transporter substrate binding protein [Hydrogenophaga sp.]|jgi:tripartite-type tricarboxylate transporter receptor subunit TctC|uniref:Bug family tripartite tricarboxylate transporter substrate binding protein n=1 Tax=Hydrogenophaga sp. TaxID=1904254 RepID=UPI001DBDE8B8|nr:tripartite tricarboxylate transporter substrate binding protein [Hydrogenophaga sp.]MBW0171970.1 tripartite tricarboxylate transporter substrate binding protein [Hydrogenophaga sp.]MBW0185170.1 tripartite tricarboxylate transporter substrate binding protein [Hydrogenophaga sp.]
MKRTAFRLALALIAATAAHLATAQDTYPNKPVRFVNNFPAGGPSDLLARSVAAVLQESLKQAFVVDNKAGVAGNIGATEVARAPADGYTVLFGIDTTFTVNPHLYANMPFKRTDLKPLVVMASSGLLVGVNPSTGIKTLAAMVDAGKTRGLNFSSAGSGSPGHLAIEVIKESTQAKLTHIPYRGNTPAVTAVLAGEVDGGVLATPGMLPHVQTGKITALAVTSRQRSRLAPELPTVAEAGLKSLEQEVLYIVMVPAATPDAVVQTLQKHIVDALKRPEVQARMNNLDLFFEGLTGAPAAQRIDALYHRYGPIVKATGMKVE